MPNRKDLQPPDYAPPMRHEMMAAARKAMAESWRMGFVFGLGVGACFGSAITLLVLIIAIKVKMS